MNSVFSQEVQEEKPKSNEFGGQAGFTTGVGLSYRHWFNKVGFQITALPIKTDNFRFYSAGITGLYSFIDSKYVKVFGYIGNHYYYREYEEITLFDNTDDDMTTKQSYNIGFGPGFAFGRIVTFNLMIGYGLFDVLGEFNMFPTGEIGLYFKF
jgi:hypothetical protein